MTSCGMPNSGPRSMLASSKYSAGTHGTSRSSSRSSASSSMNVPCSMRVVAGPQGVLDALGRPAVAGDLQLVVVGRGDDRVHLLEGHAERVVVVGVGRGGVAGGVGLDPLDAVLDQLAHGGARVVRRR